jgi:hypothetical protein
VSRESRRAAQAWAKLHRSFQATEGGEANDAANYLTGGFNTRIDVPPPSSPELGAAWARIARCAVKDVFLSTGLRSGLDEDDMEDLGLMTGHAYSLLQCYEVPPPPPLPPRVPCRLESPFLKPPALRPRAFV